MTWVLRRPYSAWPNHGDHRVQYFNGRAFVNDRRCAIRFGKREFAVGMLGVLRKFGYDHCEGYRSGMTSRPEVKRRIKVVRIRVKRSPHICTRQCGRAPGQCEGEVL